MVAARARTASASSVTATGRAPTTRMSPVPAASAAAVMVGTMWSPSVFGPVIQVMVPAVRSAASFNIAGPSAATMTGTGTAPSTAIWAATLSVSPSKATFSPAHSGTSAERYSRMWRTGFSNDWPYMFSITISCESPTPRVSLPPLTDETVSACDASAIGWRE